MRTPQSFGNEGFDYPYIVLVGDVGSGKSEIAKTLAHPGYHVLNQDENKTMVNTSDMFWTYDESMAICDTPDNQPEEDKFKGNIQLAAALAIKPVSQILIVVGVHEDLDTLIASIRKYSEFLFRQDGLDKMMVGVIFTTANEDPDIYEICSQASSNLGIGNTIFYNKALSNEVILSKIKDFCRITANVMKFLTLFDISENSCLARGLKDLHNTFMKNQEIKRQFMEQRKKHQGKDRTDLLFEFQMWMEHRTSDDCKRIRRHFTENYANIEQGLYEIIEKQMRLVIFDIYLDTAESHMPRPREIDVRRCPFCNEHWTNDRNIVSAICGNTQEIRRKFDVLGTFSFRWHESDKTLIVRPSNVKKNRESRQNSQQIGCGRSIRWRSMPQVDQDFYNTAVNNSEAEKQLRALQNKEPSTANENLPTTIQETGNSKILGHYVVLMGEVGVGKSSIVEKLSGVSIPTGENPMSVTRQFRPYDTYDWSMIISDTPGCNSIEDQLEHNLQIAAALNYMPVSRILITVKADIRLANVMSVVKKFDERLMEYPDEVVGVLVTHMDRVSWEGSELEMRVKDEFGIECILFSEKDTSGKILLAMIKSVCINPVAIKVNEKNFPRLFKINDKKIKIQKEISKEVSQIKEMKRQFDELMTIDESSSGNQMIEQFTYWMEKSTKEAQNRIKTSNKFTFQGENADAERGYMADMSNQINSVLRGLYSKNSDKKQVEQGSDCSTRYTFDWNDGKLSVKASETDSSSLRKGSTGAGGSRKFIDDLTPHMPLEICVDLNEIGQGKHLVSCDIASFNDKMFLVPRMESEDELKVIPMKKLAREKHRNTYIRQEETMPDMLRNSWNRMKISFGKVFGNKNDEEEKIATYSLQLQGHLESYQGPGDQYEQSQGDDPWRKICSFFKPTKKTSCEHRQHKTVMKLKENMRNEDANSLEVNICNESAEKSSKLRITIAPTKEEIKQTEKMVNMKNMEEVNLTDSDQNPTSSNKQEASLPQSSSNMLYSDVIGGHGDRAGLTSKTKPKTTKQTPGAPFRTRGLSSFKNGARYTDI